MDDQRVGGAIRAVRIRKGWRQVDVAVKAGVSAGLVSEVERGHLDAITMRALRALGTALDIRIDLNARWHGGELDRLLNARHNRLGETVAARLVALGWQVLPEVSFSIYGERGVIDLLAWHPATRTLLVVELKTEIVDPQQLLATLGRKSRLAQRIGLDRGWRPAAVSTWLVVLDSSTNRRRVADHATMIRASLPASGREMTRWLRAPRGFIAGLSFVLDFSHGGLIRHRATRKRVRRSNAAMAQRESSVTHGPGRASKRPEAA